MSSAPHDPDAARLARADAAGIQAVSPHVAGIERRVAAEALRLAYSRLPQSIVMAVGIGFGFVGLLGPFFPLPLLLTWLGVMTLAYCARLLDWLAWRRARPSAEETRRWQVHFAIGAVLAGAGWSFGGVLLLPDSGHLEAMLLIVSVLVVSATAANTLAAQFPAMVLFTGVAILPVAAALAHGGGSIERMTALALACCFAGLSIAGRQSSRTTLQLLRAELDLSQSFAETAMARRQAEATSLAKSQFLANMSHEVRTPLNGVLGLAELLGRGQLTSQQRTHVQLLQQSGEHLLRIVNEILDLSKIEAGRLDIVDGDFDLHLLLDECAEMIRPLVEREGLRFELRLAAGVPRQVAGDAHRLRQVLLNLLTNAAKFTERGRIALCVDCPDDDATARSQQRARIRFAIEDSGIGVPDHDAERIFEAFTQAEERADRRYGGTGLGLALCRQLAELMGGTVTYAPREGGGSVFTVSLALRVRREPDATNAPTARSPIARATPAALPPITQPPHIDAPMAVANGHAPPHPDRYAGRILLAEDNPVNQEVMLAMLESFGIDVQCVQNGHEAVAAAREGGFDMVLMDCQMPLMDGYTATGALRAAGARDRRFGPLPIVALTANAFAEDRERALAAGMNDFVAKPVVMAELHRVLTTWLPPSSTAPAAIGGARAAQGRDAAVPPA